MTTTKLCLRLALVGSVAGGIAGCDNPTRTGPPNDVVFFGLLPGSYELCFYVREDFTALDPSAACDRDGTTPFAFNIEVEGGSDSDGNLCAFTIEVDESIPIAEDGTFEFRPGSTEGPQLTGIINVDSGFDTATGAASVATQDGEGGFELCEVMWTASSGPVCRAEEFARCQLLADCCDSIYQVPPVANECQEVVDACDPDACDALLAGFQGCQQPPICPLADDPGLVCTTLDDCCVNLAPLTQEEILECQQTALQCNPLVCAVELNQLEACASLIPGASLP